MPKSKHRRKNKIRPRAYEVSPPEKNPTPSPTWVPATATSLLGVGVLLILVGYLTSITASWPWLGSNWPLIVGFVFIAAGFGLLTRWQ